MPPKGYLWSIPMFVLMLVECLVLIEVVFSDFTEESILEDTFWAIYFYVSIFTCVLQLAGILLVKKNWFRTGGIVQIAASSLHVLKLEGLIGIMGGMQAYNYPAALHEYHTSDKLESSPID